MQSNNWDIEHEIDDHEGNVVITLEDWISNKSTLKFMKKHFRDTEKTIYIDEFIEVIYSEYKKLFQGL